MYLYKYATDERVRKPDEEYINVEGWVPVGIFNVKPDIVGILSKPSGESKPSSRNVVYVDLKGVIVEEKKVVDVQDVPSFTIKAPSPKVPARSAVSTYNRHMADF